MWKKRKKKKQRKRQRKKRNVILLAAYPPLEEARVRYVYTFIFHLDQSLEGLDEGLGPLVVVGFAFRRRMGWSFRLISRRMAVLGCQSGKALRRLAKSLAKK
jgi:hypothetical protein